jgi:hypothetical protein
MRQIHILIAMTYVFVLQVGSKKLPGRKTLMSNLSLYYAIDLSVCLSLVSYFGGSRQITFYGDFSTVIILSQTIIVTPVACSDPQSLILLPILPSLEAPMLILVGVDRISTGSRDSNSLQGIELLIEPNIRNVS